MLLTKLPFQYIETMPESSGVGELFRKRQSPAVGSCGGDAKDTYCTGVFLIVRMQAGQFFADKLVLEICTQLRDDVRGKLFGFVVRKVMWLFIVA